MSEEREFNGMRCT